jgi:DNA-binding transcriptional ArsR family regulator
MARSATTIDAFSAIAEPKRRMVLDSLSRGEKTVSHIVKSLRWPQPQVSKHLGVLRHVGLVTVRRHGRERLYSINGAKLKPIHDWVAAYEKFWEHQLDRIKERAEQAAQTVAKKSPPSQTSN